jgi:putative transposase
LRKPSADTSPPPKKLKNRGQAGKFSLFCAWPLAFYAAPLYAGAKQCCELWDWWEVVGIMPRRLRHEFPGAIYHVFSRGNEKREIYIDRRDYVRFIQILAEAKAEHSFKLYAYALMPNHYHLLVETPRPNLSEIMHHVNSWYTVYFNARHTRVGHLFQGRYKAIVVQAETHLLELSRYIHLNPVRAGLVEDPASFQWSSLREYSGDSAYRLVDTEKTLSMLNPKAAAGGRRAYLEFVYGGLESKGYQPDRHLLHGVFLGDESFARRVMGKTLEAKPDADFTGLRAEKSRAVAESIIRGIGEFYGFSPTEIRGRSKGCRIARRAAIYLVRRNTDLRLSEIGDYFGISANSVFKVWKKAEEDGSAPHFARLLGRVAEKGEF